MGVTFYNYLRIIDVKQKQAAVSAVLAGDWERRPDYGKGEKNMRKKFLCMMLAGTMALSMTACGGKDKEEDTPSPTPSVEAQQPSEAPTEAPSQFEDFSVKEMLNGIFERTADQLPALAEGSETELTELYKIDASKVEEFDIRIPMMNVIATEFAAFKAVSEDDVQAIVDGVNQRIEALKEQWGSYLPAQLELVENNKVVVQGRYVFMIIGESDIANYAENVFLRKFDPSIEEVVLVRKFSRLNNAVIKELSEDAITVEYTEEEKTYTFECTFSEYFYAEGGIENFAVGDVIEFTFEEPVPEAEGTMKGSANYIAKTQE